MEELTISLTRYKFALICIEIDFSKLLNRGFWIGDDLHRVVVVLYKQLLTFNYICGMVGYGFNSCIRSTITEANRVSSFAPNVPLARGTIVGFVHIPKVANQATGIVNPHSS